MLKEKQYKTTKNISRYTSFPIYYNTDDKVYQYGMTGWIKDSTLYVTHKVELGDTLDSLALYYYGNPTYYWMIADYNKMDDCFAELSVGTYVKIPTFSDITFN